MRMIVSNLVVRVRVRVCYDVVCPRLLCIMDVSVALRSS